MSVEIVRGDHSVGNSAMEHVPSTDTLIVQENGFIRGVEGETQCNSDKQNGAELHPTSTYDSEETTPRVESGDCVNDDGIIVDTEKRAIDGGWGWLIVLGALLLRTVIGGLGRSHGLFYIKFKERYNGSATSTALVTSLTGFIRLSAGPVVSILSGRFKCRLLTTLGAFTLFIGLILTAFSFNLQFLYFSYGIVTGLGRALSLTPVPILLGYYFDKRRSLAFGLASAGFSIGGFAITPVVELLFQHYGYQGTFLILSGFGLNILVSSALFRPIELHRKLSSLNRKNKCNTQENDVESELLPDKDSVTSLHNGNLKLAPGNSSKLTTVEKDTDTLKDNDNSRADSVHIVLNENSQTNRIGGYDLKNTNSALIPDSKTTTICDDTFENGLNHDKYDKLTNINGGRSETTPFCIKDTQCVKTTKGDKKDDKKAKHNKTLISWSILKDVRFLSYVFATFCFTLPAGALFLPALAKSKGVTEIQAAALLSVSAGFDTLFRVLSGIVLDLRIFRSYRPQIYNGVTFLQGSLVALYPSMSNFSEFIVLSAADGAVQGIKNAQGAVIMMDMLGVDKLASSMAVTMTVQCVAVFLGPTISGQLIDASGSYNGAFYFASVAILMGAVVMACGNIAKFYRDRKLSLDSKDKQNS